MSHCFRNIFFSAIMLMTSYGSCFSMEEGDKLLRRNISSGNDLSTKEKLLHNSTLNENTQVAPECGCVHLLLDCLLNYWGYYPHKNDTA